MLRRKSAVVGSLAIGLIAVGAIVGLGAKAAGSPQPDPAAAPPPHPATVAANPGSCAGRAAIRIDSTQVRGMSVADSVSGSCPAGLGLAAAGPLYPTMVWYRTDDMVGPGAAEMLPGMVSSYAVDHPTAIAQVTATIQTFASPGDASSFASGFAPSPMVPQVLTSSGRVSMRWVAVSGFAAGSQSLVTELSLPEASVPSQIQVVIRDGDTVLTVAAVGGTQLRASDVEAMALSELHQLKAVCGVGY